MFNSKIDIITMEEPIVITYGTDDRAKVPQDEYMYGADRGNDDG